MPATTRQKGRMLVRKEKVEWEKAGWVVDVMWSRAMWLNGTIRAVDRDLFHHYDLTAAHLKARALALVQVTVKPPSQKGPPLFNKLPPDGKKVNEWMEEPDEGFEEIITVWRKLGKRKKWTPRRVWW